MKSSLVQEHLAVKGRPLISGLYYSALGPCYICMDTEECAGPRKVSLTSAPASDGAVCAALLQAEEEEFIQSLTRSAHLAAGGGWEQVEAPVVQELPPQLLHQEDNVMEQSRLQRVGTSESNSMKAMEVRRKNITTLMMRGLSNASGTPFVASWLCQLNFEDHFDVVYTPYDIKTHTNQGYAFINFSSVEAAAALVEHASGMYLEGSDEAVQFWIADIQGSEALVKKMAQRKLYRIRNPQLRPHIAKRLFDEDWMNEVNSHQDFLWSCTQLLAHHE
mmetsp:Transcript_16467/g.38661  ORF Transcript_16467/g.38661 Transcript_16467/m.38661 type:complete len:276 (-) Transcript_16467:68-895(-)